MRDLPKLHVLLGSTALSRESSTPEPVPAALFFLYSRFPRHPLYLACSLETGRKSRDIARTDSITSGQTPRAKAREGLHEHRRTRVPTHQWGQKQPRLGGRARRQPHAFLRFERVQTGSTRMRRVLSQSQGKVLSTSRHGPTVTGRTEEL